MDDNLARRLAAVERAAWQLFDQKVPWCRFFREVFGNNGIIQHEFIAAERERLENSGSLDGLLELLTELRRSQRTANLPGRELTKVITVRLPRSVHEHLRRQAHDYHTSMNLLCISKLMRGVPRSQVPTDDGSSSDDVQSAVDPPSDSHGTTTENPTGGTL